MRLRGLLLRTEQRKSNRNQLSVIRPIILIPCPPNDWLHFQPGSVLPHVRALTSEGRRRMDRVNGKLLSRDRQNKTPMSGLWWSPILLELDVFGHRSTESVHSKSRKVNKRELAKKYF